MALDALPPREESQGIQDHCYGAAFVQDHGDTQGGGDTKMVAVWDFKTI